jgi:hypothetical protein
VTFFKKPSGKRHYVDIDSLDEASEEFTLGRERMIVDFVTKYVSLWKFITEVGCAAEELERVGIEFKDLMKKKKDGEMGDSLEYTRELTAMILKFMKVARRSLLNPLLRDNRELLKGLHEGAVLGKKWLSYETIRFDTTKSLPEDSGQRAKILEQNAKLIGEDGEVLTDMILSLAGCDATIEINEDIKKSPLEGDRRAPMEPQVAELKRLIEKVLDHSEPKNHDDVASILEGLARDGGKVPIRLVAPDGFELGMIMANKETADSWEGIHEGLMIRLQEIKGEGEWGDEDVREAVQEEIKRTMETLDSESSVVAATLDLEVEKPTMRPEEKVH